MNGRTPEKGMDKYELMKGHSLFHFISDFERREGKSILSRRSEEEECPRQSHIRRRRLLRWRYKLSNSKHYKIKTENVEKHFLFPLVIVLRHKPPCADFDRFYSRPNQTGQVTEASEDLFELLMVGLGVSVGLL